MEEQEKEAAQRLSAGSGVEWAEGVVIGMNSCNKLVTIIHLSFPQLFVLASLPSPISYPNRVVGG
jgi:hypothetical protein